MNKNILTFDEWAVLGKDQGMEKGHHASVQHMLNNIFAYYEKKSQQYSVIDLGSKSLSSTPNFRLSISSE